MHARAISPPVTTAPGTPAFADVDDTLARLAAAGYVGDREIAVATFLAAQLGKPLLLEGPAGVGKTELAKAVAAATGRELVRLQCYEGLDESKALYEWEQWSWHRVTFYGDLKEPVQELAKAFKMKIVEEA